MLRMWSMRSMAPGALMSGLLCVLLALAGCQFSSGPLSLGPTPTPPPPTLPSGWTWYHDSVYPFEAPVPPGWQAHGYWNEISRGDHCQRKLDLVPPVSQDVYQSNPYRLPEFISITIATTCPDFVPARDNQHLSPAGKTTIVGAAASMYTQIDDLGDQRVAITRFGGHQYVFSFYNEYGSANPQSDDAAQLALYDTLLKDFVYQGK